MHCTGFYQSLLTMKKKIWNRIIGKWLSPTLDLYTFVDFDTKLLSNSNMHLYLLQSLVCLKCVRVTLKSM